MDCRWTIFILIGDHGIVRESRYALSRVDNLGEDFWVHGLKLSVGSSKIVQQGPQF